MGQSRCAQVGQRGRMPSEEVVACQEGAVSLGPLLDGCRQYLLLVANQELGPELRAKSGASDMVQETFLSAGRHFCDFRGSSEPELLAWLRQILLNQIANLRRQYRGTRKRCLSRELPIGEVWHNRVGQQLTAGENSPSRHAIQKEEAHAVESAVERLPPRHREIIRLRHFEQLTFDQVGSRLDLSTPAARQLWARAIKNLRRELKAAGLWSAARAHRD